MQSGAPTTKLGDLNSLSLEIGTVALDHKQDEARDDTATPSSTTPHTLALRSLGSNWRPYGEDLVIHAELFTKGIVVVKPLSAEHILLPKQQTEIATYVTGDSFFIEDRQFKFREQLPELTSDTEPKKPQLDFADRLAYKLLQKLVVFKEDKTKRFPSPTGVAIYNPKPECKEEIFLPLTITTDEKNNNNELQLGFYVCPRLSTNSDEEKTIENLKFGGIKQFVTAGCMFGSEMRARNQHGKSPSIIKRHNHFFEHERLETISYDTTPEANPYEVALFDEFERLTWMIKRFAVGQENIPLLHHLPYYDYVLYGVQLFIQGRMSFNALSTFFKHIFLKKAEQTKKITEICEQKGIKVTVASPFDPLFGNNIKNLEQQLLSLLSQQNETAEQSEQVLGIQEEITMSVLITLLDEKNQNVADSKKQEPTKLFALLKEKDQKLSSLLALEEPKGTASNEIPSARQGVNQHIRSILSLPSSGESKEKENEKVFVQRCLSKLRADDNNLSGKIWKDFLETTDQKSITKVKELFQLANASMIAQAASGNPDYTTCSLLPFSEKKIQAEYSKNKKSYPEVLYLTVMESMITYTHVNQGLLFYCTALTSLSELIFDGKILESAHVNVGRQSMGEQPVTLEEAIAFPPEPNKGSTASLSTFFRPIQLERLNSGRSPNGVNRHATTQPSL